MNVNKKCRHLTDAAERQVKTALEWAAHGSKAMAHLERAQAHLNEAWIDCDGQNARSVEQLLADLAEGDRLRVFCLNARKGESIEAFGKKWTAGGDQAQPGATRAATVLIKQEHGQ